MIARAHRFHGYGSLRYVYQHGKTVRGQISALKFASNTRRTSYRCAVVVSKKVSKSAVVRNRIRRRVYEIVRQASANIQEPYDLVITIFHESAATMPHAELERTILQHFAQAKVLVPDQKLRQTENDHGTIKAKES